MVNRSTLAFGQWLKQRREELDLTRQELARRIGYSPVTIRKIEAGVRRPSKEIAALLGASLEVDPTERFLGSVRRECLDHLLIFNDQQLHRVMKAYVAYFNRARPHQGMAQKIPGEPKVTERTKGKGKIIAFPVLNGLHHDYRRAA